MKEKILCQNENCEMQFLRTDLDDHMKNNCRYRTLKCTYCNDDFAYVNQEVKWSLRQKIIAKY